MMAAVGALCASVALDGACIGLVHDMVIDTIVAGLSRALGPRHECEVRSWELADPATIEFSARCTVYPPLTSSYGADESDVSGTLRWISGVGLVVTLTSAT